MNIKIPFNKATMTGRELRHIADALRRGHISGDGHYTARCQSLLEQQIPRSRVLLTSSGTHALELAAHLIDLKPGDEVLLPTFTFPSTANAFVLKGAIPRFVDIRTDTLNMDERLIEAACNRRTRAIVPVHYAGVPCEMTSILATAKRHQALVIEDAAHALGATYKKKAAGTFGVLNAFSFHETKNVTSGEGGALAILDHRYVHRAEIIRQKGTNRAAYYRGEVDKYTWTDIGSSYVPSELQAAFLLAQLQAFKRIRERRRVLFERYYDRLQSFQQRGIFWLPTIPPHTQSAYHLFHIILDSEKTRDRVIQAFKRRGILAVFHYVPLHLSPMGRRYGYKAGMFPVAEDLSLRLLRLPFYTSMTRRDQDFVIQTLKEIL